MRGDRKRWTRRIALDGAYNVRDLGGYAAAAGRHVRKGAFFRADALDRLTDEDVACLSRLGLRTVVDFRTEREIEEAPDRTPGGGAAMLRIPIGMGNIFDLQDLRSFVGEDMMLRLNVALVREAQPQYRAFFTRLSEDDAVPLLFHCSAGKDRTGFAAAMLLSALGVSRRTIYRDYLASAQGAERKYGSLAAKEPHLIPLLGVRRAYLAAAFAEIDAHEGDVETYLHRRLGVDIDALRARYTE